MQLLRKCLIRCFNILSNFQTSYEAVVMETKSINTIPIIKKVHKAIYTYTAVSTSFPTPK